MQNFENFNRKIFDQKSQGGTKRKRKHWAPTNSEGRFKAKNPSSYRQSGEKETENGVN